MRNKMISTKTTNATYQHLRGIRVDVNQIQRISTKKTTNINHNRWDINQTQTITNMNHNRWDINQTQTITNIRAHKSNDIYRNESLDRKRREPC